MHVPTQHERMKHTVHMSVLCVFLLNIKLLHSPAYLMYVILEFSVITFYFHRQYRRIYIDLRLTFSFLGLVSGFDMRIILLLRCSTKLIRLEYRLH
jgi:hypothetical protein